MATDIDYHLQRARSERDKASRSALADTTDLTSVHVNRTLKVLEADGLIERTSPRAVVIGNWKKLAEIGDFNSAYLHMPEDEPALVN